MLLKKLKLDNFRQFKGQQEIVFSTDKNKNVTVIMGENGSGKTSLAQAFTWCLYGETEFKDKSVINRIVSGQMLPNHKANVRVDIYLEHKGTDYCISREQNYQKDLQGQLKPSQATFNISYKKGGQQEFLPPVEADLRMKEILPQELSRYFFFDGERIDKMSKEIQKGKSKEFAQAVRGLLGLSAFIAALDHLNPRSKYGVIGSYNASYDSSSDSKIGKYSEEIEQADQQLSSIEKRLVEIESEVQIAQDKCDELTLQIEKHKDSELLQKEKEQKQEKIKKIKQASGATLASITKLFNTNASSYFAKSMIKDSLEHLSKAQKLDKGVPDIHARTIDFLIKRGICLCGTKVETGNDAYMKLNDILNFIPPQSIGSTIGQFVSESEVRTKTAPSMYDEIKNEYTILREYETDIDDLTNEIKRIEDKLVGMANVSTLQSELMRYEQVVRDRNSEKDGLNIQRGSFETKRKLSETERSELSLRDKKNRKIEIYKAYAQYMFDELTNIYEQNENEVRSRLENNINEIFKNIYEGGLSLTIDENYNIQVLVNEFEEYSSDVETSTAQSISIIFAFISGIIKIARETYESSEESESSIKMLESEPYPLVMDAPLSSFDKRRIQNVCEALPQIANQVIFFIKDTDGELAEQHMGIKVGKRYLFDKKNEIETYLMPR